MPLTPGSNFGPYRIVAPLGRGGMASVYKAHEPGLDRYIALKVLPPAFLHDPDFAERFDREAKLIAQLEHRHIVPIYSFGIDEDIPWMAMRLVGSGALSSQLKNGPIERKRAIEILAECAEALDYAHERGILHRDVKPQNVLLDLKGHVYLADFGIAKMIESSAVFTETGMIQGTPQYMSPEQARSEAVDRRTDIYALGIVAYEMLTGRLPFTADTPVAVLMKHVMDPIPIPSASEVPEPILRPLLRCLAKNRDERWQTAGAFVRALRHGVVEATSEHPSDAELPTVPIDVGPQPLERDLGSSYSAPLRAVRMGRTWFILPSIAGAAMVAMVAGTLLLPRRGSAPAPMMPAATPPPVAAAAPPATLGLDAPAATAPSSALTFTVLAGSYRSRSAAVSLAGELTGKGYSVVVRLNGESGAFEVRVGPGGPREAAERIQRKLKLEERIDATLVRDR